MQKKSIRIKHKNVFDKFNLAKRSVRVESVKKS